MRAFGGRFFMQATNILALLEMQVISLAIADDDHIHKFAGILGSTGAKSIKSQGIFIVTVPAIFAAGIEFTKDQLPVVPLLCLIPIYWAAAALVVHLDGSIQITGDGDKAAVASTGLVNSIGQNLKYGMLATLQPVRTKNNTWFFPDPVGALESSD